MKRFALSLLMLVPTGAVGAQTRDPGKLVGSWSGSGTFFSAELKKKVDSLPFVLHIEPLAANRFVIEK